MWSVHAEDELEGDSHAVPNAGADDASNPRTDAGFRVRAELDKRKYPTGVTATDAEMDALSLHRNEFHGDWNYEVHPR